MCSLLLIVWLAEFTQDARAATYTVANTNDAGAGSLRAAIDDAEGQQGKDEIHFSIPGAGPHTIVPLTPLPVLAHPVVLDGYSEPGAQAATRDQPAELMIEIDASNVGRGIELGGNRVEVRGLALHSALYQNVYVEGHNDVVAGNHIGTNRTGDATLGSSSCNVLLNGNHNRVGGPAFAERNVIAGGAWEVCVEIGSHELRNNRIGTNAQGTADLGWGLGVVLISDGSLVRDNLVSGLYIGVEVIGDDNTMQGNRIGTNANGTAAIPNGDGINVEGGDYNIIGGTAPGEGNLISGNAYVGIQLEAGNNGYEEIGSGVGNQVLGNLIGVDQSGAVPLGNGSVFGLPGILISGADANQIGGHEPGAGNVIAANAGDGISISSGVGNNVFGNAIGTNMDGALGLGNGQSGIHIRTNDNHVGDQFGTSLNTIAYNGEDGVTIDDPAVGNTVVRNLIFVNGTSTDDLGIDLAADGVTANDEDDVDAGANNLLNYPLVTAADSQSGAVTWTLSGLALTDYRLEFYASTICPGGIGVGQRYLGSTVTATDGKGDAAGTTTTATSPVAGDHITMTATRRTFTGAGPFPTPLSFILNETSEFSPCQVAE